LRLTAACCALRIAASAMSTAAGTAVALDWLPSPESPIARTAPAVPCRPPPPPPPPRRILTQVETLPPPHLPHAAQPASAGPGVAGTAVRTPDATPGAATPPGGRRPPDSSTRAAATVRAQPDAKQPVALACMRCSV
jgi:hypothetical protein